MKKVNTIVLQRFALSSLLLTVWGCSGAANRPLMVPQGEDPVPVITEDSPKVMVPQTSTSQVSVDALAGRFAAGEVGAFARRTAPDFSSFTLANGIPVVLKHTTANKVISITVVLRGGASLTTAEDAGLESIALRTMERATRDWPYEKMTKKLDETSSSIQCATYLDYAMCSLSTLDRYVDDLLPILSGIITEPSFTQEDFDFVLSEARLNLQGIDQDPWAKTSQVLNDVFFAGHPYAARLSGTESSLAGMTLEKATAFYNRTISANRLFIVAVGNLSSETTRSQFETAFGRIEDKSFPIPLPTPRFAEKKESTIVKHPFAASKGVAYLRGDFSAPLYTAPDYPAFSLALNMLSDLLFNVVRDRYGAVYSSSSSMQSYAANYGSIRLFKTTVPDKVKAYVDEAVAELVSGKVMSVSPGPDDGPMPRQTIAEALSVYKERYINETYAGVVTNNDAAGLIIHSVFQQGDPRAWLLDVDRVMAVTPEEVSAAVLKWLINAEITWVALGSKDVIDPVKDADFTQIGHP